MFIWVTKSTITVGVILWAYWPSYHPTDLQTYYMELLGITDQLVLCSYKTVRIETTGWHFGGKKKTDEKFWRALEVYRQISLQKSVGALSVRYHWDAKRREKSNGIFCFRVSFILREDFYILPKTTHGLSGEFFFFPPKCQPVVSIRTVLYV